MFEFDFSGKFRKILVKLAKKDAVIAKAINRKVKEVVARDKQSINIYKNLRQDLKNLKRVHITDWLVMTFEVDIENNLIRFVNLAHRDRVYKKK